MPSEDKKKPKPPTKIAQGRFELKSKLGAGCFGEVYKGVNVETGEQIAVKTEEVECSAPQLESESETLLYLAQPTPQQGFTECFFFGREGGFRCLVMELLGKSLEDMVQKRGGKFTPKTTVLVAEQVVRRIEYLHSKGIVHRDIKPENFMFGAKNKQHHIYAIDFGLSKRYWDKQHITMRQKLSLTGTARYASINAHKGIEQSRRDDLEAIGHMLLYFLRGSVPWSGLDAKTKQDKYRKICEKKQETPLGDLCAGFPPAFEQYLRYSRELQFMDRPDYEKLYVSFQGVREQEGHPQDWEYEWMAGVETKDFVPLVKTKYTQPDAPEEKKVKKKGGCFGLCGGSSARDIDD
jgi:serine/threonine protein kinase